MLMFGFSIFRGSTRIYNFPFNSSYWKSLCNNIKNVEVISRFDIVVTVGTRKVLKTK